MRLKPSDLEPRRELPRHLGKTTRGAIVALLIAGMVNAQSTPGTIATHLLGPGGVGSPTIIDAGGNVYVTGGGSPVTPGAAQTQPGGGVCTYGGQFVPAILPCPDAQVTKFDASGNLVFSTLLGGASADNATALAIGAAGNVFITGTTGGLFPTTVNIPGTDARGSLTNVSGSFGFAAKISADGSTVLYSTYLPGQMVTPSGIAIDAHGNAYIVGATTDNHGFIVKISSDGSSFLWSKLFSGSGQDAATNVTIDATGNIVVAGHTTSPDLPTTSGVYQAGLAGMQNLFLAKLDSSGDVLFTTYLGGSGTELANQLKTDAAGNIVVVGATSSLDFPTTSDAFLPSALVPLWNNASPGGYTARLTPDGENLLWSSYVPSAYSRGVPAGITSLAIGPAGDLYVAGIAGAGFPVTASAPQPCLGNQSLDAFVAHVDVDGVLLDATYIGDANLQQGLAVLADGSVLTGWHLSGASLSLTQVRFGGARWTAPACLSSATLNSATLDTRGYLSPGEFVTLTGVGIGPDNGASWQGGPQDPPLALGGVEVLFDNQPAPMLYAQSRQVNVLAPFSLAPDSSTTVTVKLKGAVVGQFTAQTSNGEPGFFRLQPNISAQAFALNQDGTLNSATNPAAAGTVVALWGTGFGPLAPACATGGLNAPGPVSFASGYGVELNPGNPIGSIQYAGGAPTLLCGIDQINLLIPAGTPSGPLTVTPGALAPSGNSGGASVGSIVYVK